MGSNPTPSFMVTVWKNGKYSLTLEELLGEIREVPVSMISVETLKLFGRSSPIGVTCAVLPVGSRLERGSETSQAR